MMGMTIVSHFYILPPTRLDVFPDIRERHDKAKFFYVFDAWLNLSLLNWLNFFLHLASPILLLPQLGQMSPDVDMTRQSYFLVFHAFLNNTILYTLYLLFLYLILASFFTSYLP